MKSIAGATTTRCDDINAKASLTTLVRVPLCVVYDLERDKIKRGRVYIEMPVLLEQLGVGMG